MPWGLPSLIFHISDMELSPYEPSLQPMENIQGTEEEDEADPGPGEIALKASGGFCANV